MSEIKVGIKAQAYERTHPKTLLSQFENDTGFTTAEDLVVQLDELRQWVLLNFGSMKPLPKGAGDIYAGDIASVEDVTRQINCGDVRDRYSPVRMYFYGGNVIARDAPNFDYLTAEIDGLLREAGDTTTFGSGDGTYGINGHVENRDNVVGLYYTAPKKEDI